MSPPLSILPATHRPRPLQPAARRAPFTLIELLVVVAIISVLASLLMPALGKAREQAKRAVCMSDRRQNAISVQSFCDEHDGKLPTATATVDANGYKGLEPSDEMSWHGAVNYSRGSASYHVADQTHEGSNNGSSVWPLGTLARFGYVGAPDLLYCPSYDRGPGPNSVQNALDGHASRWEQLTAGTLQIASTTGQNNAYRYVLGVSWHPWVDAGGFSSKRNLKMDYIAETHGKSNKVSPLLISCKQRLNFNGGTAHGEEYLYAGYTLSHKGSGVNVAWYDGSVSWLTAANIRPDGWLTEWNHIYTGYPYRTTSNAVWLSTSYIGYPGIAGNLVQWGRKKARL